MCVKVTVGVEHEADVRAVAAVHEAIGPAVLLRVDANMGWRTANALVGGGALVGRRIR